MTALPGEARFSGRMRIDSPSSELTAPCSGRDPLGGRYAAAEIERMIDLLKHLFAVAGAMDNYVAIVQ